MKVKQLIKKLQKCKPNSYVYVVKLESGSSGYNILKAVATETMRMCIHGTRGREIVGLINNDSFPPLKEHHKLKVVR